MVNHLSFGLALSGGGARGLAHIVVLTVLQREGLVPDVIVGSSIGAVLEAVPCAATREMGAQTVIAVDVGSRLESPPDIRDGLDVVQRATEIMMLHLRSAGRRVCDVLVEPDVTPFTWADFDRYGDIVTAGEQAARDRLPAIRSALSRGRWEAQIQRLRERLTGRGQGDKNVNAASDSQR